MNTIYHVHAIFMMLWVTLAILQPFLIQQKKIRIHKLIGKISYFVMPLVFITGYSVIRHTYYANLNSTDSKYNPEEIRSQAAASIDLGLVYFIWLVVFYCLAVINRKKTLSHATYMFGAILTILGPTVDRLIYNVMAGLHLHFNFIAQNAVLFSILLILVGLSIYQKRNGNSPKPSITALTIYALGTGVLLVLPHTCAWQLFVEIIM